MSGAIGVLWSVAQHQDREFARESRLLVANALSGRQRALQGIVTDFGFWTDAYRSISLRLDHSHRPEAPESWRHGMIFATPARETNAYAASLIDAALNGASLEHY